MKKIFALILVVILLMDLTSCHAYIDLTGQEDYKAYQDKKNVYVIDLETNQDSTINFGESFRGKIINGEVISIHFHQVILPYAKTDTINTIMYENSEAKYIHRNGNIYKIIEQKKNGYTVIATDTIRIPFSEIKKMHIKENYPGKSALLGLGIVGISFGLVILIAFLTLDMNMSM
jgi:hypothetical protein